MIFLRIPLYFGILFEADKKEIIMVRLFMVECPKCKKSFEAHYAELRHTDIKLHCPYCGHWFEQEDSERIDDRW